MPDSTGRARARSRVSRSTRQDPARFDELILPPGTERISLGEGATPLLPLDDVLLKCEHMNPTGSYKDRVASVALSIGSTDGAKGWVGTSSGNAGASFAAYGARARMPGWLFTVDGIVPDKLAHVQAFGAEVWEVAGFGHEPSVDAAVFDSVAQVARAQHLVLGITARSYNAPAMDGIKAIAFEIVAELDGAPQAVYVPTAGGGLLASLWKGFAEARQLGMARDVPRLIAVQAAGCAPIHLAAQHKQDVVQPVSECRTQISGLQLTNPPDGNLALEAVRASAGWTVAVSDADALAAQRTLAAEHGLFVEPAAALGFAGYQAAPIEDAVVIVTGNGLKGLAEGQTSRPGRLALDEIPDLLAQVGTPAEQL